MIIESLLGLEGPLADVALVHEGAWEVDVLHVVESVVFLGGAFATQGAPPDYGFAWVSLFSVHIVH